jgi:hypothetical protein
MASSYFPIPELLIHPPLKRAAYSDRTAWILASLSHLIYSSLPGEQEIDSLVDKIIQSAKQESKSQLDLLIREGIVANSNKGGSVFEELSRVESFSFIRAFNNGGTQAFLASLKMQAESDEMLILIFRGTQTSAYEDVLTDMKAWLVPAEHGLDKGRVHKGFLDAHNKVQHGIQNTLKEYDHLPLYIAGHSLGGALAVLAARFSTHSNVAATYTYGCPRVADDKFYEYIRTPIYRIVNAADGVARMPFGQALSVLLWLIRIIPINGTFQISEFIRKHFAGYTHLGHLTYLSNDATTNHLVVHSPDIFWRAWVVTRRILGSRGRAMIDDHDIIAYRDKLFQYARWRNPD